MCCLFSGCPFSTVLAAIDAADAGETAYICAGLYPGDTTTEQSLSLVGAEDGSSPGITIVYGSGTDGAVRIGSEITVGLQRVRISGGADPLGGGGIINYDASTLTGCTISATAPKVATEAASRTVAPAA